MTITTPRTAEQASRRTPAAARAEHEAFVRASAERLLVKYSGLFERLAEV